MVKKINNAITSILIINILLIFIGLIMCIFPNITIKTLGILIGIIMILNGCFCLYININYFINSLFKGIISLALGIMLLLKPDEMYLILPITIGIWIILSSINNISVAIFMKKYIDDSNYILTFILALVTTLIGVIVICNPFEYATYFIIILGICIIISAILNIIDILIFKKHTKNIKSSFKNLIKELEEF